ncbi:MAG: GAF domain-containing protein [Chloroflexia bacterium]|nr:GAF domain-containing protein [Chloroflexia bacterium]
MLQKLLQTLYRWLRLRTLSARLLLPLLGLMLASLLASTLVFVLGTARTRDQLLQQQAQSDVQRVESALLARSEVLQTSLSLLAHDPDLQQALRQDTLSVLTDRAVVLRSRFSLDLIHIYNRQGIKRVNLVTEDLYQVSSLLDRLEAEPTPLVCLVEGRLLLLSRRDLVDGSGILIAGLDLEGELRRIQAAEQLPAEISLRYEDSQVGTGTVPVAQDRHSMSREISLGRSAVQLVVSRQTEDIRRVMAAGLHVMVASTLLTTVLLGVLGYAIMRNIAQPIRRLYETAQLVAQGDLRQRVPLPASTSGEQDEVTRLSQVFNHMVERVESYTQELEDEKNRLEALHTITSELSRTLDPDEILLKTLDLASMATGRSLGMVLLRDPGGDGLLCRALLDEENVLRAGREALDPVAYGALQDVLETGLPLCIADAAGDPRAASLPGLPAGACSVVAVPLAAVNQVLGVILLSHSQAGFFDEDQVRLLMTLGREVSNAIHNAELYRYINEQSMHLAEMLTTQRKESSQVRAILQSIADGVIVVDWGKRIILANRAAQQILDISRAEIEGRTIDELPGLFMPGGALAQDIDRFPLLEDCFINVLSTPVVMDNGETLGQVYVLRDITREVEADRAKNEFVSTISHELRTPLTSIKGYVELMMMGTLGEIAGEQRRFLEVVMSNANRLVDLVNDLLDISRMETGRLKLEPEAVSIHDVIDEVLASAYAEIERKQLELEVRVPPELPLVQADRKRLVQVLTNLVSNAYKYTYPRGRIVIAAGSVDACLQVSVADTGVGIAPKDMGHLFTRFFRADNPLRDEVGGSGLGLSIAKSFIEMQGGRMWVESELDVGSTFYFSLPLNGQGSFVKEGSTTRRIECARS